MKTKIFLLGAIGMLAMASCSNDELVGVNHDGDEIAFNVVTNAISRANTESGGVYCNGNLPKTFHVWAKTADGKTYIEGDEIIRMNSDIVTTKMTGAGGGAGAGSWINNSGTRYWPAEGSLDFYAAVNATSGNANYDFNWNNGAPTIAVNVPTTVADQKDLLYAVKTGQTKTNNYGRGKYVGLNFRHALSQVVFTAQNVNPNLHVVITGVSACNVKGQGTFTYPTANTDDNIDGHPTPATPAEPNYTDNSWGSWAYPSDVTLQDYSVTLDAAVVIPGSKDETVATSLTNTKYTYPTTTPGATPKEAEYSANAMLLLPQTSEAWKPTSINTIDGDAPANMGAEITGNPAGEPEQTGTYFLVKCLIYNIAGTTFNPTSDVCLWGNRLETTNEDGTKTVTYEAKEVAIPVKLDWKQGKKYIYNFVFGNAPGGFDPVKPVEPVLAPITFNVTVDEFIDSNHTFDNGMLEELVNLKR